MLLNMYIANHQLTDHYTQRSDFESHISSLQLSGRHTQHSDFWNIARKWRIVLGILKHMVSA